MTCPLNQGINIQRNLKCENYCKVIRNVIKDFKISSSKNMKVSLMQNCIIDFKLSTLYIK